MGDFIVRIEDRKSTDYKFVFVQGSDLFKKSKAGINTPMNNYHGQRYGNNQSKENEYPV